jgi:amino-acid N-acetyltransferase
LASVAEGMIYLRKLGLVSIIVLDSEEWTPDLPQDELRAAMTEETMRFAELLEQRDTRARPILEAILREAVEGEVEADSLLGLRAAIAHGDIPILPPFALDASLQSRCVSADKAVIALARALAHAGHREWVVTSPNPDPPIVAEAAAGPAAEAIMAETSVVEDLTPLRMMIINREGGVPSPARGGNPHLSINLESEYKFIEDTFVWQDSHPTALRNLALTRACLAELPRESSALIVSHRSPKSLVANLITNKPAFSPSLHHSLLPSATTIQHTPTIVRRGLPIRVLKTMSAADEVALTTLLEASFGKTLDRDPYFAHLRRHLDFVIVAGDWAAAAVVTAEGEGGDVCYLDKFAVLPTLQGDGTVDFLWGALRDETSGLGLLDALNNNGGAEGVGRGRDLVWRSRADNPVNRWYFERSSGFVRIQPTAVTDTGARMGAAHLFWCDAEERVEALAKRVEGAGVVADEEKGRLKRWAEVVGAIPSCWKA